MNFKKKLLITLLSIGVSQSIFAEKNIKDVEDFARLKCLGLYREDYKQAVHWCEKAAEQGDEVAMLYLGLLYQNLYGKENEKFIYWIKKSAEKGYSLAQDYLGSMYYEGVSITQNYKQAFYWFEKAAKLGDPNAQNSLAIMYVKGEGVRQNKAIAKEWFGKACDNGNQMGCNNYRNLNQ